MNDYIGIDYGMRQTNIDHSTGVRYGVLPMNYVSQSWCDSSEGVYPNNTCPYCGCDDLEEYDETEHNETTPYNGRSHQEYACPACEHYLSEDQVTPDEPRGWKYENEGYRIYMSSNDPDLFVELSPYYTHAQFCSPCAPGACYLLNSVTNGPKAYCLGPDWFDESHSPCPYPVYDVITSECVYRPSFEGK